MENFDRGACIVRPMSSLGSRVKHRRKELGLSLPQLAARVGGIAWQTIQDLEKDKSKATKHLLAMARALGVEPEWLEKGTGPKEARRPAADEMSNAGNIKDSERHNSTLLTNLPERALLKDKIKVLGMAECGPDGWALWNGDVVDRVDRPPNLANAIDAYAVFITGDSMEDRYHAGEIAFIHPGKPPTPGSYVLVQRRPKMDGDPPMAVIKRLVRRSGDRVILEQLNPKKTITLALADIISMHRVVGSGEP